jgi:allantoate deiminase
VDLVLELRSERDADRAGAIATLTEAARDAATRHGCTLEAERSYAQPAVTCDPALSRRIREAAGRDLPALPSGATHDASAMADLCPIAMLFLRCRGGISHRPDEFASPADMGAAVDVLAKTLAGFGSPPRA